MPKVKNVLRNNVEFKFEDLTPEQQKYLNEWTVRPVEGPRKNFVKENTQNITLDDQVQYSTERKLLQEERYQRCRARKTLIETEKRKVRTFFVVKHELYKQKLRQIEKDNQHQAVRNQLVVRLLKMMVIANTLRVIREATFVKI